LSIVFVFVSCEENDYYRVVSVAQPSSVLTAARDVGTVAVGKDMTMEKLKHIDRQVVMMSEKRTGRQTDRQLDRQTDGTTD